MRYTVVLKSVKDDLFRLELGNLNTYFKNNY